MRREKTAGPFLKWAGGKRQLLEEIKKVFPRDFAARNRTYIEPFVGSGAVLFFVLRNFPEIAHVVINDTNEDLIRTYRSIAVDPHGVLGILEIFQQEYHRLEHHPEEKQRYYYEKRDAFNLRSLGQTSQSALFIFLNKTCFNGLYRVNRQNRFNVPIGYYKRPTICDSDNILLVSEALGRVEILHGDFEETLRHASPHSLFYFDPPYKPLSATSNFTSYSSMPFGDWEQVRLRDFCDRLDREEHAWILSNSDVQENRFFDDLYSRYHIKRVPAKRLINANPQKRGALKELLITNHRDGSGLEKF